MWLSDTNNLRTANINSDINLFSTSRETKQRVTELAYFGGFSDSEYLKRTLAKEFQLMESWYVLP